jgi:hypothetical protein
VAPARPGRPARGPTGKKLAVAKPPPVASLAQQALDGRAVLQAARELLVELSRCARAE